MIHATLKENEINSSQPMLTSTEAIWVWIEYFSGTPKSEIAQRFGVHIFDIKAVLAGFHHKDARLEACKRIQSLKTKV